MSTASYSIADGVLGHETMEASRSHAELVERLSALDEGCGIEVIGFTHNANTSLRYACHRRGFSLSFRRTIDGYRIYKTTLKPTSEKAAQEISELNSRYMAGERLEEIGKSLGISRQAVQQRIARFCTLPVSQRKDATDQASAPYLEAVGTPACILCKQPSAGNERTNGLCQECKKLIKVRIKAAQYLRYYIAHKVRQNLANALVLIRKHNIQPEDLKFM